MVEIKIARTAVKRNIITIVVGNINKYNYYYTVATTVYAYILTYYPPVRCCSTKTRPDVLLLCFSATICPRGDENMKIKHTHTCVYYLRAGVVEYFWVVESYRFYRLEERGGLTANGG